MDNDKKFTAFYLYNKLDLIMMIVVLVVMMKVLLFGEITVALKTMQEKFGDAFLHRFTAVAQCPQDLVEVFRQKLLVSSSVSAILYGYELL